MKLFGIEFDKGHTYLIVDKHTQNSSREERARKLFKASNALVVDSHKVQFKSQGNNTVGIKPMGVYITGFHANCPFWQNQRAKGMSDADIKAVISYIKKEIITPYEASYGLKGTLEDSKSVWYDTFFYNLMRSNTLTTDKVEDKLILWFALLSGNLCAEANSSNPEYIDTPYMLEEKGEKDTTAEDKMLLEKHDAEEFLYGLEKKNYVEFLDVVKYLGLAPASVSLDKQLLKSLVLKIFNDKHKVITPEKMIEICNLYQTPEGKDRIQWSNIFDDAISLGILVKNGKTIDYKSAVVGSNKTDVIEKLKSGVKIEDHIRTEILNEVAERRASKLKS